MVLKKEIKYFLLVPGLLNFNPLEGLFNTSQSHLLKVGKFNLAVEKRGTYSSCIIFKVDK